MWVYSDLLKDKQWTFSANSSKAKGKTRTFNTISMLSKKDQSGNISLTNSEVKIIAMTTNHNEVEQSGTLSGNNYLKDYLKVRPSKSAEVPEALLTKQKELCYQKDLEMDSEAMDVPFRLDVLAQFANTPARITLYALQ